MSTQPTAMTIPEAATSSRLTRRASTMKPAGIWKAAAAMLLVAIARPIAPACQCLLPAR